MYTYDDTTQWHKLSDVVFKTTYQYYKCSRCHSQAEGMNL